MVWLKSPKSHLSKTFFRIENPLNIKKVMSKNISNNNNAAMLLMSHVGDIGDVIYISIKDQCYSCQRCQRCEISQCYVITVLRYFTSSNYIVYYNSNYSN